MQFLTKVIDGFFVMGALLNNSYSYNTLDFAKKILFDTSIG